MFRSEMNTTEMSAILSMNLPAATNSKAAINTGDQATTYSQVMPRPAPSHCNMVRTTQVPRPALVSLATWAQRLVLESARTQDPVREVLPATTTRPFTFRTNGGQFPV